jgi:hypothetical protein
MGLHSTDDLKFVTKINLIKVGRDEEEIKFNAVVYSIRIVGNRSGSVGSVCFGPPGSGSEIGSFSQR